MLSVRREPDERGGLQHRVRVMFITRMFAARGCGSEHYNRHHERSRRATPKAPPPHSQPPRSSFDVDGKRAQLGELERQTSDRLCGRPVPRTGTHPALSRLKDRVDRYDHLESSLRNLEAMDELLEDERDPELTKELESGLDRLEQELETVRARRSAGGSLRRSRRHRHPAGGRRGDRVAGLGRHAAPDVMAGGPRSRASAWRSTRSITARRRASNRRRSCSMGRTRMGSCSAERGVHRLVRISPFDAQKRRHTSFAALDVIPLLDQSEEEEVEIPPRKTYGSTSSVPPAPAGSPSTRRTPPCGSPHLPSGIVVACQNERSAASEPRRRHAHPEGPAGRARPSSARGGDERASGENAKRLTSARRSVPTCSPPTRW